MEKKQNWYVNKKKYHFIYKTTCTVNEKYYYGMHSTDSLDDGYIGSGTRLWHSIKKYGRENFQIEILEFCSDRESLKQRERELICKDMLSDPMCMNLKLGGEGGFTLSKEQYKTRNSKCGKLNGIKNKELLRERFINYNKATSANRNKILNAEKNKRRIGTHRSDETKSKISLAVSGKNNGMYGMVWIFNEILKTSKRVLKEDIDHFLNTGWLLGRKIKFN